MLEHIVCSHNCIYSTIFRCCVILSNFTRIRSGTITLLSASQLLEFILRFMIQPAHPTSLHIFSRVDTVLSHPSRFPYRTFLMSQTIMFPLTHTCSPKEHLGLSSRVIFLFLSAQTAERMNAFPFDSLVFFSQLFKIAHICEFPCYRQEL